MMKKSFLFVAVFVLLSVLLSGCDKNSPMLVFSSAPVTKQTNTNEKVFSVGQPIYYAILMPKGFKNEYIRFQIVKKEEKNVHWGYKIYQSKDYHVDTAQNYFLNSFALHEAGYYFVQVFAFNDLDTPLVRNDFWVK